MANLNLLNFIFLVTLMTITTTTTTCIASIKGLYWLEQPLFPPSAINTSLFTHVYYAFLQPNNVTYQLHITNATATTLTTFTPTLQAKTPSVTTLISIGGSNSDVTLFSLIASNFTTRAIFINSTINVARTFGFHGVDLDWEFPQTPDEMNNLGLLFAEWRAAISAEASATCRPPLLLTAAVYFAVDFFLSDTTSLTTYPVDSINKNVDWVNVMSYDLHGPWSNHTGPPSGLFDPKSNISVSYGLYSWIRGGTLPQKMVMGLALYGRTWQLRDPSVHGIGAPSVGSGPGLDGAMAFFQVLDFNNETGVKVVYDVDTASVYSYSGSYWVGYDDPFTVAVKVGFAQALSLRGYFFWAAGLDTIDWKISTKGKPIISNF
ncbi:nod factor hydrolase protein 1-like [Abrus precatorius]|uniref:Nod factor hydrolase protein 1-like n=1 Tax=Abrus precatorius TaxID=3816 RepID=A0A8B8MME7_ABRPR|nr:nod factor hydrolase protein 1-like [Abrus precatorius]